DPVERYFQRRISNLLRLGKSDIASKRNHESHVERAFCLWPVSGEAVQNSTQTPRRPMLADKPQAVLPGIIAALSRPAVNHNRQLRGCSQFHLPGEDFCLRLPR